MKRIILTVAAVFAFGFANAQEEVKEKTEATYGFAEGDMYVEGSILIRTDDNSSEFSFNPKLGYMLDDKLSVGGDLDFGSTKEDGLADPNGAYDGKSTRWGIGGFARYNFLTLQENRFVAYGQFGLGFASTKQEKDYTDPATDTASDTDNSIKANIDLGLNYFILPNLAATFTLANILSYNNENPEEGDSRNSFEFNVNLFNNIFAQPQFGLLYKF